MAKIILEECPNCGSKNQKNKTYCDYCGSLIEVEQGEIAGNKQTDNKQDTEPVEKIRPVIDQETDTRVNLNHSQPPVSQPSSAAETSHLKTTSGLAITSFVLAFFPILWLIALILGIIANVSISKPDSNLTGRGFSTAAIIMSSLGILSGIIIIIIIIASGITLGAMDSSY